MCVDVSEIDGWTTAWSPNNSIGGRCCRPFSAASAAAANEKLRGPHHRHGQIWRFTKRIPVIADGPFPPTHISANNSLWCLHFSLVRPFCCVCLAGTRQICRLVFILEKKISCYASRSFDGRVSLWPLFSMASIYPSTIRFTMLAGSRATTKTAKIQMKLDRNVFKMLSVNWWVFRERIIDVISPRWKEAGAFPGILPLADWESNEYYILLKKKSCKRYDICAVPSTP